MSFNVRAITTSGIMELTRAGSGFTGTAQIARGDKLTFDTVTMEVVEIEHHHQVPHGDRAPISIVWCNNTVPEKLSDEDVLTLRSHGFK